MQCLIRRLETEPMTRILALGSSNTELGAHAMGCHNWVDWLDVGLRQHFGRKHIVINAGVSGQTTSQMLERFDRDVALFQPHAVFITGGGNDSNPDNGVSEQQFRSNLVELAGKVRSLDAFPILQTYYAFDVERMQDEQEWARRFPGFMQVTRNVAAGQGVYLIDHLKRWERLRLNDIDAFRSLMRDSKHVNPLGNMLIGLDVLRHFGVKPLDELVKTCREGLEMQRLLDNLEERER